MAPSREDATLLVRLATWGQQLPSETGITSSENLPKTWREFKEKYPPSSKEFMELMSLMSWWEMLGSFYKRGLIAGELIYDWMSVAFAWKRLGPLALSQREEAGDPRIMENFELLAKDEQKYGGLPVQQREPAGVGA